MPQTRTFAQGLHARPFLQLSREVLVAYVREAQLTWVHDESNDNQDYDRNFLRHAVLPVLSERWPRIEQTLLRVAAHCAEQEALIETLLNPACLQAQGSVPGTLSIAALLAYEPAMQKTLIRRWIAEAGHVMPGHKRLDEILHSVMTASMDAAPQVDWAGVSVRRYRDDLYILPDELTASLEAYVLPWDGRTPLVLPLQAGVIPPSPNLGACEIRFDQKGLGLKKDFQEQGIPPWQRARVPLLYEGGVFVKCLYIQA